MKTNPAREVCDKCGHLVFVNEAEWAGYEWQPGDPSPCSGVVSPSGARYCWNDHHQCIDYPTKEETPA